MPTEMLTKDEASTAPRRSAVGHDQLRALDRGRRRRVRRLKINVAAWVVGTILLTTLWALNQWDANGAFESFGHEGESGQWNPTLWALAVGLWGLIVGIMALRVYVHGLRYHVAAWLLGMIVLSPLWALLEWQDNGGLERFGNDSRPGEWEPWILYVGGIWALVIAGRAVQTRLTRPRQGVHR